MAPVQTGLMASIRCTFLLRAKRIDLAGRGQLRMVFEYGPCRRVLPLQRPHPELPKPYKHTSGSISCTGTPPSYRAT